MDLAVCIASVVLLAGASLRFGVDSRPGLQTKETYLARQGYQWN